MVFLKNFKSISAILSFVTILSLFQTVSASDSEERKCPYFCNIQGTRYGNTISQNNGKTLLEHAKELGDQYQYYMLCCDGVLKGRDGVTIVSSDLKVLPNSLVKMRGEFPFMPINRYCSTYCAHDLDNRISYFKYSEELTLEKFVKKYSAEKYKSQYHLFTYCCDGQFKSDRMTLTRHFTEFSLHIPSFKVDNDSLSQVKSQLKKQLINSSCSYYCNIKNKSIVSISKSNDKKIQDYASGLSSAYDSVIKCCDGKVNQKSNVAVYNKNDSISYYQDIATPYLFEYTDFNVKCDNYCGFNTSKKTITLLSSPEKTVFQAAKAYKSSYDYMTYCCYGKKEIKGILITINAKGEERAIDTEGYAIKTVEKSSAVSQAAAENAAVSNAVSQSAVSQASSDNAANIDAVISDAAVHDVVEDPSVQNVEDVTAQDTTNQENVEQETTNQESYDQNANQESYDQNANQETYSQDTTNQETYDQNANQESYGQDNTNQETYGQDNTNQETYNQDNTNQETYDQEAYSPDAQAAFAQNYIPYEQQY